MAANFSIEDEEKYLQICDIGDRIAMLCELCGIRTTMIQANIRTLCVVDFRLALDDAENSVQPFIK